MQLYNRDDLGVSQPAILGIINQTEPQKCANSFISPFSVKSWKKQVAIMQIALSFQSTDGGDVIYYRNVYIVIGDEVFHKTLPPCVGT